MRTYVDVLRVNWNIFFFANIIAKYPVDIETLLRSSLLSVSNVL